MFGLTTMFRQNKFGKNNNMWFPNNGPKMVWEFQKSSRKLHGAGSKTGLDKASTHLRSVSGSCMILVKLYLP